MPEPLLALAEFAARWLPNGMKKRLYRIGPISRALRNSINKAAPSGIAEVRISGGPLRGSVMLLDLQSEKEFWLGSYEMPLMRAIEKIGKPAMVAYDLGANIGYISLQLSRVAGPKGSVFAFEALPANLKRLASNLELNTEGNTITPIEKALADRTGKTHFLVHASGGMGKIEQSQGRNANYLDRISVEAIALDDFVYLEGHAPPQLIKMDIEGGEGPALEGMARILLEHHPDMLIELHGPEAAKSVWQQLTSAGYELYLIKRGFPKVSNFQDLDWKSYVLAQVRA